MLLKIIEASSPNSGYGPTKKQRKKITVDAYDTVDGLMDALDSEAFLFGSNEGSL